MEMHWFESNSAISPIMGELKTSDLSDKLMVEKDEFIGVTDKLPNVSQRRH